MTKNQKEILEKMREDSTITAPKIAKALSLSINTIENNIKILKEAGYIIRHGEKKGGYWEVVFK